MVLSFPRGKPAKLSVRRVSEERVQVPGLKRFRVELTGFDLLTGHAYVPCCYFVEGMVCIDEVRRSLAETLERFPILTVRCGEKCPRRPGADPDD
jgi:hypothetical protein